MASGVTEYLTDFGPIWLGNSPLWFVLVVATSMAALAVLQGRAADRPALPPVPDTWVFGSPLFVLGLYLATSFYPWRDGGTLEALVAAGAGACFLTLDGTRRGWLVGVLVALAGTTAEWTLVQAGVFRYLPGSDELFGVAPWLLPLYFTASVCAGAVGRRMLR